MNRKNAIIGSIVAVVAIGAIGGGVWYSNNNKTAQQRSELEEQLQTEATTVQVEVPTENSSAGIYEIKSEASKETVDEALYSKIASINTAIDSYYSSNKGSLLCVYGLMYSDTDDYTVSVSKIATASNLDFGDDIDNYADALLIRPSDLSQFDGLELKHPKSTDLTPYSAYHTSEGYIISSSTDAGGIITADQYRTLLGTYATDHGTVHTPNSTDEDYLDIAASAAFAFDGGKYEMKYVACDDTYGVAVIGSLDDPTKIAEYIMTKKPGGWAVLKDGIEKSTLPRIEVNNLVPDMDLGLLPKYTIAEFGDIKTGFIDYEQSLVKLGMLTADDMPEVYSCGAGRFAYIEMSSGKKLLGIVNSNKQLEFYEVSSTNEAIAAMVDEQENPPIFILKFSE
jgi:hypothetical protein